MNITKIKVNLTGEDLLSIYSEFVSVEGLEVKNIEISDGINITGRLNKGFNIDFLVNLKFESYENNIIKIEITKIKVLNIGILKFIKNMAIKYLLKSFKEKGITYNKGKVEIEYKYVLKDVSYVDFDIENIFCYLGCVNVEVSNVQVSTAGLIKKDVQLIDRSVAKDYEEDEEVKIIRTKKFGIKPMYPEDACVQMELLGHNFFVFFNAETEQVNVVYKRKGNTYGLIEPEF